MYLDDIYIFICRFFGMSLWTLKAIDISTKKKNIYIYNLGRIRIGGRNFTPANTGLEKANQFPELGSVFKASFLKSCLWYYAKLAVELSEKHPEDTGSGTHGEIYFKHGTIWFLFELFSYSFWVNKRNPLKHLKEPMLQLIAICHYALFAAFYIMDHGDILFHQSEADDACTYI